jgi:hypothetical protein
MVLANPKNMFTLARLHRSGAQACSLLYWPQVFEEPLVIQWLQWLQWGVTFSQVVWLIGC